MRRTVNNDEVPHLWANRAQPEARNSNGSLYFHGDVIYSYGSHFPIATFIQNQRGETAVLLTTNGYSTTTAAHCGLIRAACSHIRPRFNVPLGGSRGKVFDEPVTYLRGYHARIQDGAKAVVKSRKANTRAREYSALTSLVDEANEFCRFFGLPEEFVMPADFEDFAAALAEERKREVQAKSARAKKLTEENAEKITRWLAGDPIRLPPALEAVYLRIEGDEVVTSKGARFPVSHAVKGLALVRSVKASGRPYKRNGHTLHLGHYVIDRIEPNGTVHAGCHHVEYQEIERIAPQVDALATNLKR